MNYEQDTAPEEIKESPSDGERRTDYELDMECMVVIEGVAVRGDVKDMVGMDDAGRDQRPDPYDDFDDMLDSDLDLDPHYDSHKPRRMDGRRF
ncbi:MAG: hypothetical protein Q9204_006947 [Flavoplaca sp. TL-2023a]